MKNNITIRKINIIDTKTDAIVNSANEQLLAGGGVCGAIFTAAGKNELEKACNEIGHCDIGKAIVTPGFALSKYIIHTVGPRWNGGNDHEEDLLYNCYIESMNRAVENNCKSITFPVISSGIFGYPQKEAWIIAIKAIDDFLKENYFYDINVIFAVLDNDMFQMGKKILFLYNI